jgi:hypothetical protein
MKVISESVLVLGFAVVLQVCGGSVPVQATEGTKARTVQAKDVQAVPPSPSPLPRFTVVGEDDPAVRVIVVDPTTSEDQLIALVNGFRAASAAGTMGQLLTPTTPKAPKGPYQVVWVLVMSDPQWATSQRAHKFFNPTEQPTSAFSKEYGKRVRASYYYSAISRVKQEYGTIGFYDQDSGYTSPNYRKLF